MDEEWNEEDERVARMVESGEIQPTWFEEVKAGLKRAELARDEARDKAAALERALAESVAAESRLVVQLIVARAEYATLRASIGELHMKLAKALAPC